MKRIALSIAGGLLIGAFAATHAKLPPPTPEQKAAAAAKAEKDAAAKAKAAEQLSKAHDKAVEDGHRIQRGASPCRDIAGEPSSGQQSERDCKMRHGIERSPRITLRPSTVSGPRHAESDADADQHERTSDE